MSFNLKLYRINSGDEYEVHIETGNDGDAFANDLLVGLGYSVEEAFDSANNVLLGILKSLPAARLNAIRKGKKKKKVTP